MAYHSHALSPAESISHGVSAPARPGFFGRMLAAMMKSRQKQADREIVQYLRLSGGKLTDHVEREIERRFLSGTNR